MACQAWKCVPTTISGGMDISEVPAYHACVNTDEFSVRVTKITSHPTVLILTFLILISTADTTRCNNRDDSLHISFTLKISIFSVAYT